MTKINNKLVIGNKYSNNDISAVFKCSNQGGMRRSLKTNSLILIAKHNNSLYDDVWDNNGILYYTGMGMVGDQNINFSQNKTLLYSKEKNINVYLFESYKSDEYYYAGEVEVAGNVLETNELDKNSDLRRVFKFPLKRLNNSVNLTVLDKDVELSMEEKIKKVRKLPVHELKLRAKNASKIKPVSKSGEVIKRSRDLYIAEYTTYRANGKCDLCKNEAPFNDKNGYPFLEEHHIINLANDGPDALYNTVALCPNCHRKIHILKGKKDILKLQKAVKKYLIAEKDLESLEEWKKLFERNVEKLGN